MKNAFYIQGYSETKVGIREMFSLIILTDKDASF